MASKLRKQEKKLNAKIAAWDKIKDKKGYKKPGSMNQRKAA